MAATKIQSTPGSTTNMPQEKHHLYHSHQVVKPSKKHIKYNHMGGFLKCWVSPTTMGFPTKNDQHLGRFGGYHYLRKHPYIYMYYINIYIYICIYIYIRIYHINAQQFFPYAPTKTYGEKTTTKRSQRAASSKLREALEAKVKLRTDKRAS